MIASTLTMTRDARARGYAVPAVNILDDLSLRAVVAAAEAARSPLIVQVSVKTVRSIGTDLMTTMFRSAADRRRRPGRAAPRPLPRTGRSSPTWSGRAGRRCSSTPPTAGWRTPSARPRRWSPRPTPGASTSSPRSRTSSASRTASGSDVALHAYDVETLVGVAERTGVDLLAPAARHRPRRVQGQARPAAPTGSASSRAAPTDRSSCTAGPACPRRTSRASSTRASPRSTSRPAVKVAYMHSAEAHLAEARGTRQVGPAEHVPGHLVGGPGRHRRVHRRVRLGGTRMSTTTPALIFDCDGVLADTERDGHLPAFNQTFADAGVPDPLVAGGVRAAARDRRRQGAARVGVHARLRRDRAPALGPRRATRCSSPPGTGPRPRTTRTSSRRASCRPARASPGSSRRRGDAGWQLAVASTSAEASVRAVLEHAVGAERAAQFAVFAGDVVPAKKPAPDIYLLALRELGLGPRGGDRRRGQRQRPAGRARPPGSGPSSP